MERVDICIIGAGPGGAISSLFLAQKGISSVLVDKAIFPRDKVCGDALSGKVVEVLNKLDPDWVQQFRGDEHFLPSWGVTFFAPNTKNLRIPFKKEASKVQSPPGFVSKRVDFDSFLVDQCRKNPLIDLREGKKINSFKRDANGWTISDENENEILSCKLLIVADGAQSRFARELGKIKMEPRHHCAGLRAYYKGVTGNDKENFIELHFLKEFLPGYFWIFPLPDGMCNIGVGMRSDKVSRNKINLKKEMERIISGYPHLAERFIHAERIGEVKGFGLPLGSKKRKISGVGFLLVGDAASLIDPFTGEGIGNAMVSGMFAAEQAIRCLETNNFSPRFLLQYDKEVYKRLWPELKLSTRMQKLVKFPSLFNFVVNKAGKNKVLRETISCMFEDLDLRDRLRSPGFYLKLLFSNEH